MIIPAVEVMGAMLCKGSGQQQKYIKVHYQEEEDLQETLLRSRPRRFTKFGRPAPPKFILYDMEEFKQLDDHEGVRRLLLRIPEWLPQRPFNGYIEYWYYFRRDGIPLTPSRRLYPAARARLPWPILHTASQEMLQNFAYVVNRIAHCQLLSVLSTMDDRPYRRQEKQNFSHKAQGRTKRLNKRDQPIKRSKSWRPMSLVKQAYFKFCGRNHGTG